MTLSGLPPSEVPMLPARTLLGPGPSDVNPRVLKAMTQGMIGYLDPDFTKIMDEVTDLIRRVYQTKKGRTMALSGTGMAGMEAGFASLVEPGDTVIMEHYVYSGTLAQFRKAGANVVGTPIDDDSIIPEDLEALIEKLTAEGKKPKVLYTIPEFQNPTGNTLPTSRRKQIIDICRRHHIVIIEDECYTDLRYEGETQVSFRSLDDSGMVIYVGSFSKILAPGLRLGYFVSDEETMRRALSFRMTGTNHFTSLAVYEFLNRQMYEHIDHINVLNRPKRDAMVSALGENFGGTGTTWSTPKGSLYLWVTFPEHVNATELMPIAFKAGVGFNSGASFAPNGDGDHCARLCYGYESPQKNRDGIALLAEIMEREGSFKVSPGG